MGVFIGKSTKIVDRATGEISYGEVPANSVVVAGSMPGKPFPNGEPGPSLYCAVIVKRVDAQTRSKTSINELLERLTAREPARFLALALYAKRWHDRDKSGWWSLIGLVPIIGAIWLIVELGILEGVGRQQIRTGSSCLKKKSLSGCSSASRAASAARPIFLRACCSQSSRHSCSTASRWCRKTAATARHGRPFWFMVLISVWANLALCVKRLHDFGRPGIIAAVLFIPVISIVAFIALCLIPGNPGPNQYGNRPNAPAGG